MDNAAGILLIVGSWLLPIAILVYLLRAINTSSWGSAASTQLPSEWLRRWSASKPEATSFPEPDPFAVAPGSQAGDGPLHQRPATRR